MEAKDQDQAPELSQEQAADRAALLAAANEGQAVPVTDTDTGPAVGELEKITAELAGLVTTVTAVLGPAFPSLTKIYTPEATQAAAGAVAAVCVKHGWLSGGVFGEYGEEITAALVVGPLAIATVQGIKADMAARAAKEAPKAGPVAGIAGPDLGAQVQAGPVGSKEVTFGAPAPATEPEFTVPADYQTPGSGSA